MKTATKPKFYIGQKVNHKAFTDCFKKDHAAVLGLTVIRMTLVEPGCIPDWFRITAVGENGLGWVQASERFFEAAEQEQTLTGLESAAAEA
jgi:hypothetical protein